MHLVVAHNVHALDERVRRISITERQVKFLQRLARQNLFHGCDQLRAHLLRNGVVCRDMAQEALVVGLSQ